MYTSQENVENIMGALTTEQAAYFNDVVVGAVARYIDRITGTTFGSNEVVTVYVSGDGGNVLSIPTMHGITVINSLDTSNVSDLIPEGEYYAYPRGSANSYSIRHVNGSWDEEYDFIITGKLGYADVPDDIAAVATSLAVTMLRENSNGYKSEKVGDWQVTYKDVESSVSPVAKQILEGYQRLSRKI